MPHFPTSLFVVIFIIIVAALIVRKGTGGAEKWPFEKRNVLSEIEQIAYWRLRNAAPEFVVLAQVAMSAFINVKRGERQWRTYRNRFSQKYVDFAVCRKDGSIVAVVEIDDKSHLSAKRAQDGRVKNQIIEAAGIPILRWKATPLPSEDEMRADIGALAMAHSMTVTQDDRLSRG
jgi:hypothetical protein